MPQISYISIKDIKEARRYDAEYFKPEYLETLSIIKRAKTEPLSFFIKDGYRVVYENTEILVQQNDQSVGFLQASDLDGYFLKEELGKVKYSDWEKYPKGRIKRGEILIEVKGNAEKIAIVPDNYPLDTLVSGSLYKFTPVNISGEFLLIWLTCKHGENLKSKLKRNLMVHFIGKEDLYNIPVPILPQSFQLQIEEIVKSAHKKQALSKQLYKEAEHLLLTELGLVNYEIKHKLWFSTTKKQIEEAHRYDSEYFQPKYAEIIEKIESYEGGWDFADEMVKWKKGIEVGTEAYTETGKDFIRVSDFSIYGISEVNRKISDEAFEELKKNFQPKQGDILFTKDGTIGISYVLKEDIKGVLSGAFLRLTLKEKYKNFEKECLSLIFNSILCKMQVEKLSGGALIAHLKPSDFETFKIPLIKPQVQKQIAEKIQESHKLRKESKELLEEAKRKVEEEIEKAP